MIFYCTQIGLQLHAVTYFLCPVVFTEKHAKNPSPCACVRQIFSLRECENHFKVFTTSLALRFNATCVIEKNSISKSK